MQASRMYFINCLSCCICVTLHRQIRQPIKMWPFQTVEYKLPKLSFYHYSAAFRITSFSLEFSVFYLGTNPWG